MKKSNKQDVDDAALFDRIRKKVTDSVNKTLLLYAEELAAAGHDRIVIGMSLAEGLAPVLTAIYGQTILAISENPPTREEEEAVRQPMLEAMEAYRSMAEEAAQKLEDGEC